MKAILDYWERMQIIFFMVSSVYKPSYRNTMGLNRSSILVCLSNKDSVILDTTEDI